MGFGLADELAYCDTGLQKTSCRWAGCCGDAGGERELAWALTAYPGSGICEEIQVLTGWDDPGLGAPALGVEPAWRGPLVGSFWLVGAFWGQ